MSKQHNKILTALFTMVIMTVTTANVVQAAESKDKEAKELKLYSEAKISLTEAHQGSGAKSRGKAMEAELDDESNTVQLRLKLLKTARFMLFWRFDFSQPVLFEFQVFRDFIAGFIFIGLVFVLVATVGFLNQVSNFGTQGLFLFF